MKTQIHLLILCIAVITIAACNKKKNADDDYPAITQSGSNVMACKVNGKPIVYKGVPTFGNENGVDVSVYGNDSMITSIWIHGSLNESPTDKNSQTLFFEQINPELNKKYFFNKDTCFYELDDRNTSVFIPEYKSFFNSGWVQFTSLAPKVVAGTFETIAVNSNNDTIRVTEGRFDISR